MARISRNDLTDSLVKFFLSSGEDPTPDSLSSEVLLTYPFAYPGAAFDNILSQELLGAAASTDIKSAVVSDGFFEFNHYISVSLDDTSNRNVRLFIETAAGHLIAIANDESIKLLGVIAISNVIVPNGARLFAEADAMGAGKQISIARMFTTHKNGTPVLR